MKHKNGCPAEGGYGHGKEQCICGADSATLPSEPRVFDGLTDVFGQTAVPMVTKWDYDALRTAALALESQVRDLTKALDITHRSADDQMFQKRAAEKRVRELSEEA